MRPGRVFASREPARIRTLLGSCVAVCLCDPKAEVGGMNHFMLPGVSSHRDPLLPARYGVHAMELLINAILTLGGDRRRFRAMAFGGASVLAAMRGAHSVAQSNIEFVVQFLETESIPLVSGLLGGEQPMNVTMMSATGAVRVELVGTDSAERIAEVESILARSVTRHATRPRAQVTLF